MSEQPVITLEELKTIIENVSPLNIHIDYGAWDELDDYSIIKDNIEINFIPVYGNDKKVNVTFKISTEKESVWETYNIDYHELIKPLKYNSINSNDRRKAILDTFGIEDKPSDLL